MNKVYPIIFIGIFIFLGIAPFVIAPWVGSLNTNLVAYWKLDETSGSVIESVAGRNGSNYLDRASTGHLGRINNSYNMSQQNERLNLTDLDGLTNTTSFSYSLWFNLTGTVGAESQNLIHLGLTEDLFGIDISENGLRAILQTLPSTDIITSRINITRFRWIHVVATYNGSTFNLYLNGTLMNASIGGLPQVGTDLILGNGNAPAWNRGFNGTIDEVGFWNKTLNQTEITELYNNGAGVTFPVPANNITLNSPLNATRQPRQITFNATLNFAAGLANATVYVWHINSSEAVRNSTNAYGFINDSLINVLVPFGELRWNVFGCSNATNFICIFSPQNYTLYVGATNTTSIFNSTIYETAREGFIEYVTIPSSLTISSAKLIFNGTSRTATSTLNSGSNYTLNVDFDIPLRSGATTYIHNFTWNVTFSDGTEQEFARHLQTWNATNFTIFGASPQNSAYINFTFKNETASQENVVASIPSSTWVYYLGSGTVNKTFTYSTSTEVRSHAFAFYPQDKGVNIDLSLSYRNTYSEQRTYSPDLFRQTNGTQNVTLFLLPSSEGIFVTFQVLNSANQPVSGALVTLTSSTGQVISSTTTGASGTTTVFLNPDSTYTLTVSKAGFSTFTATQTFPNSEFTINLGGNIGVANDYTRGITTLVRPLTGVLFNNTDYNFNLTLTSGFWTLEEFGFYIHNSTGSIIARTNGSNSGGGFLSTTNNTANHNILTMNYFWRINGSYSNATTSWTIKAEKEGSIKGFLERLTAYMSAGLLGTEANDRGFTISIIVFIIVFIVTGIMTLRFGVVSEVIITGIVFAIIGFLDAGLHFLPGDMKITIFAGIIWIVFILREFVQH